MRMRHSAEVRALAASFAETQRALTLPPRASGWREAVERIATVLGAIGILGFVASCLGIARGVLDPESYLALSTGSLLGYTGALLLIRYLGRPSASGWPPIR